MCAGTLGAAADVDRLPEGIEEAVTQAVAHVRVIDATEPARLFRQGDQLVGVGEAPRRIVEPRGHAPGALLHRRTQECALVPELGRRRRAVVPADRADPERGVPDQVDDVDGHPVREQVEVLLDRGPPAGQRRAAIQTGVDLDELLEVPGGRERRVGAAVDADDLGRDPLPDLGLVTRLRQDHQAGVGVHVDEARTDHPPGRVDGAVRRDAIERAPEQPHPLALDSDRAVVARIAGAIDDEAARDQEIEHGGPSGRQSITGSGPGWILTP